MVVGGMWGLVGFWCDFGCLLWFGVFLVFWWLSVLGGDVFGGLVWVGWLGWGVWWVGVGVVGVGVMMLGCGGWAVWMGGWCGGL